MTSARRAVRERTTDVLRGTSPRRATSCSSTSIREKELDRIERAIGRRTTAAPIWVIHRKGPTGVADTTIFAQGERRSDSSTRRSHACRNAYGREARSAEGAGDRCGTIDGAFGACGDAIRDRYVVLLDRRIAADSAPRALRVRCSIREKRRRARCASRASQSPARAGGRARRHPELARRRFSDLV